MHVLHAGGWRQEDGGSTRVMGAPDCLAVRAATRLQSLLRSRFSSRTFCSRDRASSGTSATPQQASSATIASLCLIAMPVS